MKKREPPSALLILSAIDLLLASLVCAVVLFIALVGAAARSGANNSQEVSPSAAPVTLHVLFLRQTHGVNGVAPAIFRIEGAEELSPPTAANPDSLSMAPLRLWPGTPSELHWWALVAKPDATQLTFSGIPPSVVATVNLGTRGMYHLALRCKNTDWTLRLGLDPLRIVDETCTAREGLADIAVDPSNVPPPTPRIIVTTISPATPAWRHLAPLRSLSGVVSAWVGADRAIPADASSIVYSN